MKFLLLPLLLLISCGSSPEEETDKEEEKKKTGPERRIVGRIASVSKAGEFVLIQKFGAGVLPDDVIYQSQGPDGRTASLRPSGERVRDFYAADLVSGKAGRGDAVIGYPDPAEKEEEEKELTESEEKTAAEEKEEDPAKVEPPLSAPSRPSKTPQIPQTIKDDH